MNRLGNVFYRDLFAGTLKETEDGFVFQYDSDYLLKDYPAISITFPLTNIPYKSLTLFSFFDGLIPEGWLLNIVKKNWKLKERDRMGLLLVCCEDCIGAVSVREQRR